MRCDAMLWLQADERVTPVGDGMPPSGAGTLLVAVAEGAVT